MTEKEEQLEKQIQALEKQLLDRIASVAKARGAELSATYDEQLDKTKNRLRKVRAKKDKQKSHQVTERIASETAQVREERRQLYEQIAQLYKENKIPRFLNNRFMHAIYVPQNIRDVLIILLTLAVVLFLVPCGIYYAAFRPQTVFLIVLYIVTVLVFGGIYVALNRISKERSPQTFEKIKALRRELDGNRKNIRRMEKAIRKDKDESRYDLGKFNSELPEHDAVYEQQRRTEESVKTLSMKLTNEYSSYLGKENLDISTVDGLIGIMEAGEAMTVKDALSLYHSRAEETVVEKAEVPAVEDVPETQATGGDPENHI